MKLLTSLLYLQPVLGAIVSYDWTASWINANPDGRQVRPVISINKQWPPPTICVNKGDQIVVKLTNSLGNQTVGLHWHGQHQNGTNAQDGPSGVTQCSIHPGQAYTYNFTAAEAGTYWYHSHENGQYPDGLRGPLIVTDPSPPFTYDLAVPLTISDWYHDLMPTLLPTYLIQSNDVSGNEPEPYSALINEATNSTINMTPGKTYYFQIINMAAFAQMYLQFDSHNMTVVEVDGVYVQPKVTSQIYLANGQRYGVLVTALSSATANYNLFVSMDESQFNQDPTYINQNVTAILNYNSSNLPPLTRIPKKWTVPDDMSFVPYDQQPLLPNPDTTIYMNLTFFPQVDATGVTQNRAGFNSSTYLQPKVPTLYTVLSSGSQATNPLIYGNHSNAFVLPYLYVIEIVINSNDGGNHPIHIHGHQPQLVYKAANVFGPAPSPTIVAPGSTAYPSRRDTWTLAQYGITKIRFRADNPGVWFLHCHMEWHMSGGLLATFVEAPLQLQKNQPTIPSAMASICSAQSTPTAGNAAGNAKNFTDLTGAPSAPMNSPWGANIS